MSEDVEIQELDVHRDSRGLVSEIYSGQYQEALQNIHIGTMRPGGVRGNHYHEETREWIAFTDTPIRVSWGSPSEPEVLDCDDPFRIHLPPGIPHAFKNLAEETITFGAYTNRRYDDQNPDVEPVELL